MPPGNSNKKPTVVERCSYCRSPSCSGERNHTIGRLDPVYYGRPPTVHTDPQTRSIARTGGLAYRPAESVSVTQTAPKPAVSTSNRLSSSSGDVGLKKNVESTNPSTVDAKPGVIHSSLSSKTSSSVESSKTVTSGNSGSLTRKSPAPSPPFTASSQLYRTNDNVEQNKTAGSTKLIDIKEKPVLHLVPYSRSDVLLHKTVGSTNPSSVNGKPSTSEPAVSPSSQVEGDNGSIASNKNPGFTSVSAINTTLTAPKPHISHQISSQTSGSDVASHVNDVSDTSTTKVLHKNVTDVKQGSKSLYEFSKVDHHSLFDRNCGNDMDLQDFLKKHSKRASVFEGFVIKIIGSRIAEVRINDPDGGFKLAQLFVEKLSLHRNAPACSASMDIRSVLRVGDVIKLVCTEHKKKDAGYYYFAHQAWKTDDDSAVNNNWVNNDAESVNSFASYNSLHDSEKQQGKSASRRKRRRKVANEQTSNVLGVDISQWLDNSSQLSNNLAHSDALIEGCEYIGKVVKLRLPFACLVEVELNKSSQCIFVYSKYFYPDGPYSSTMAPGLSIRGVVSIGDVMIVIPIRSNQQKSNEFEWVARKAWPKGKETADFEINQNISEKVPKNYVEPFQAKNSDFVLVKSYQDGVILSLQTDWGLVADLKSEHAFVFSRKNSYLFGLSLKSFYLEDVLVEGDLVKFSQEEGEKGEINASLLYHGNQLLDFNSFVKAINDYCESRNIKDSIETELTMLGEAMYSSGSFKLPS